MFEGSIESTATADSGYNFKDLLTQFRGIPDWLRHFLSFTSKLAKDVFNRGRTWVGKVGVK